VSVEDVRDLVKQEKESEEELQKAEQDAAHIVEEARVEVKRILEDVEGGRYYDTLFEAEVKKIGEKKRAAGKEFDDELERLENTARTNMEKAVTFIVKSALGV
jgi:vacuolar-type H+-ATPase subunit H